jgi:hypothetical protein
MRTRYASPLLVAGFVAALMLAPAEALACGGVTATIADDPRPFGVRTMTGPGGITLHVDQAGNVYVAAADVKISSALAEAVARRYLATRHRQFSPLEFEGFTYDHGDLVYMYHAHVPKLAASMHIGPVSFATEHAHVHVSATTGDVYGVGCGLGSGIVEAAFEPDAYSKEPAGKRLPYVQFDSRFIAGEGAPPTIDGRIEPGEWKDAGHEVIHVGTTRKTITEYG